MQAFKVSVVVLAFYSLVAVAGPKIYSDAQLAGDKKRYTERFDYLLEKGLRDFLQPDEKRALKGAIIRHPLRGASPIEFSAVILDGKPIVSAPIMSIKFLEDLSVAYAWRHLNNYSLDPIDEYLVALKYKLPRDISKQQTLDPLTVLGVPRKIWERDSNVDDLSLRFRNTAWAFVLAHELGHLFFKHPETDASPAEIQRQEEAADEFAANLLARSDTIPMGMILWFQATAGYLPNRSDFETDAAYLRWLATKAEHPVNGNRMRKLAKLMRRQAAAERDSNRADTLEFIAQRLGTIGETIEDPEMQQHLKRCAMMRQFADFKKRNYRSCR